MNEESLSSENKKLEKKVARLERELRRVKKSYVTLKELLDEALQRIDDAQSLDDIGYWEYSFTENEIFISSGLRKILRMEEDEPVPSPEEFYEKLGLDVDDRAAFDARVAKIVETGELDSFQISATLKGEKRFLDLVIRLVTSEDGLPLKLVGVDRDITDAELNLRRIADSEKKFRHLFETSSVGFILLDYSGIKAILHRIAEDAGNDLHRYIMSNDNILFEIMSAGKLISANQEILRLYKVGSIEEFFENLDKVYTELSVLTFVNEICALFEGRTRHISENETKTFEGNTIYTMTITEREESDANWERITLSIVDLSYVKQAEAKVLESEMRWNYALEGNQDGVWDWNFETEEFFFSDRFKQMFGYNSDEFLSTSDNWFAHIHPDDVERVKEESRKHISGESDYFSSEYRVRCKDGSDKWLLSRGKVADSTLDRGKRFIGTITDISRRKNYEAALQKSEQLLQAIADFQMDLILGKELKSAVTEALEKISLLVGASRVQIYKSFVNEQSAIGVELKHEWTDGKLVSRLKSNAHSSLYFNEEGYERWQEYFNKRDVVNATVADLPKSERESLSEQGIRSVCAAPIYFKNTFWGFIEFDVVEENKVWANSEIQLLQNFANSFAEIELFRLAEEDLREQQQRQKTTLDAIGDAVITVDEEANVLLINPHASILLNYDEEQSRNLVDYLHVYDKSSQKKQLTPLKNLLDGSLEEAVSLNGYLKIEQDSYRSIQGSVSPIRDTKGELVGAVIAFSDVSKFEQMENELQKAQRLESIGVLAGGIAHDFNNILSGILGNLSLAELYLEDNELKASNERIQSAMDGCDRARDLTIQLLTFSKGGAPVKKVIDLSAFLEKASSFAIHGSKTRCELELSPDLLQVEVDAGQLNQVVNNLLINATQAMPDGGEIFISATNFYQSITHPNLEKGKYVEIKISDTGVGIAQDAIEKIFDPFFTTKSEGTGLGLATSFSIVKRHNGHMEVESEIGKGTTFTLYIPAISSLAEPEVKSAAPIHQGEGYALVFDDDEAIQDLLKIALKRMGYTVVSAFSGTDAVDLYKKHLEKDSFRFVILDLTVPGEQGGVEVIKLLQEIDPDVRGIVSSGYSNDDAIADFKSYGFKGRLVKPFTAQQLSEVVADVLG